jgi:hypothetical protein
LRIAAIDPGTTHSAVVIYDGTYRAILTHAKLPNAELLDSWPAVLDKWAADPVVEMIASYGMPVGREVFETVLYIGQLIQIARPRTTRLLYRKEEKIYLCGSMKAKDGNIRQALIDKLGAPGTKRNQGKTYGISGDCWAALAVAVTASETDAPPENLR